MVGRSPLPYARSAHSFPLVRTASCLSHHSIFCTSKGIRRKDQTLCLHRLTGRCGGCQGTAQLVHFLLRNMCRPFIILGFSGHNGRSSISRSSATNGRRRCIDDLPSSHHRVDYASGSRKSQIIRMLCPSEAVQLANVDWALGAWHLVLHRHEFSCLGGRNT